MINQMNTAICRTLCATFLSLTMISTQCHACGGFFCELVPINQAAEQIVFRQADGETTAMVRILYSGAAENFGWVLPVPETPTLSIGSDGTFVELEALTRPQFQLTRTGEACQITFDDADTAASPTLAQDANETEGVVVEQMLSVGPFDAQIISSDNPDALAMWLADNNLDLTERGSELLVPYIEANMKFVVLKLQNTADAGDIQPIILRYPSEQPMIPLRLTAVAAEDNMGILVWLLGESRAVPDNFLHVIPNYTRLNWYTGSNNAYASYQTLITLAMDEAGGQGFATDMAGRLSFTESLTTSENLVSLLDSLTTASDAEYVAQIWQQGLDASVTEAILVALPLPEGQNSLLYGDATALAVFYTTTQLESARTTVNEVIQTQLIEPLDNAIELLDDELYLTRLYTTLSAEEMLVDPTFVFNPDMPDQPQTREAMLDAACTDQGTDWTLTLGEGTGRTDSVVIDGRGQPPVTAVAVDQDASWQVANTASSGSPIVVSETTFDTASVGTFEQDFSGSTGTSSSSGGSISTWFLALLVLSATRLKLYRGKSFSVRDH